MKQIKVLMIALTMLMGVSLTSCLDGESDPNIPIPYVLTVKSIFPYQFQYEGTELVYESKSATIAGSEGIFPGDIVLINATYDSREQIIDKNTTKVAVTVKSISKLNTKAYTVTEEVDYNRSIVSLTNVGGNILFYSPNWIIVPIPFYLEKGSWEDAMKHSFYLRYDKLHKDANSNTMYLRLHHYSEQDATKETSTAFLNKAFDISRVVTEFNAIEGNKLKTIKIITQDQTGNSPVISPDSDKNYSEYTFTMDYTIFDKK